MGLSDLIDMIDVSIIIVNYKSSSLVNECIRSIFEKTEGVTYEIIVVDNATEDLSEVLEAANDERLKILQLDDNIGFGRANNAGAKLAKGRNLFLLNPDTVLLNNAIKILSDYLDSNSNVGVVGGNLFNEYGEPIHSYRRILPGIFWELNELLGRRLECCRWENLEFNSSSYPLQVGYITGADLMISSVDFKALGGFDPEFFMYYEETDLQCRMKRQMRKLIINVPQSNIMHLVGKTVGGKSQYNIRKRELWERGRYLYMKKNHGMIYRWISNILVRSHFYRNTSIGTKEHRDYYIKSLSIHKCEWRKKRVGVIMEPCAVEDDGSFLARFQEALRGCGDVEIKGRVSPRNIWNVLNADWIILNWWEDEYFKRTGIRKLIAKAGLRLTRAKTAIVFHNRQPHECTDEKKKYYAKILRKADRVILLTESSRSNLSEIIGEEESNRKGIVVHHPNYDVTPKVWPEKPDKVFRALFFGFLRPYKNIELLIEVARRHTEIEFTIAGEPYSDEYGQILKELVSNMSNVKLILHKLDDKEIDILMNQSHVLCLPYDVRSSQNSGVAIYAFSKGLNVIIPAIQTIKDLRTRDCVYSYDYNDDNISVLFENKMQEAVGEYYNDYVQFVGKSRRIHNEVLSDYSIERISNVLRTMFS